MSFHDMRVSHHALMRFRQRYLVPSERGEISDSVAAHWLNALVRTAIANGDMEDVIDVDKPARVVELRPRRDGGMVSYAVIRDFNDADPTIVTLLSAWMRDTNRRNRWLSLSGDALGTAPSGRVERLRTALGDAAKVR